MSDMILPNFIIAGAAKSGTTTLYDILIQHPEVGMSYIKEPNYFSRGWPNVVKTLKEYSNLFKHCDGKKAIGEASPFYFFDEKSPEEIYRVLGKNTKIILILRNPADRAYSHWAHERLKYSREHLSFEEALKKENERANSEEIRRLKFYYPGLYRYYWGGQYFEKVSRFIHTFGTKNVMVIIYEDFIQYPIETSQRLFTFLGVNSGFIPLVTKSNPASQSGNPIITRLISKIHQSSLFQVIFTLLPVPAKHFIYTTGETAFKMIQQSKNKHEDKIDPVLRTNLIQSYLPDIYRLEKLLNTNLSSWYGVIGAEK